MLDYSDIKSLSSHPSVIRAYKAFGALRHPEYPDMNYIGLNFSGGKIVSLKFYFSVYRRVQRRDVECFLPTADDFFRYYHLWEPSKVRTGNHTGCAFTVKFKAAEDPEFGFHYRLKSSVDSFRLLGEPESMPFRLSSFGTRPGINYEYGKAGKKSRRRYYYLEKQEHKDYIAKRFAWPFASECRLCEVTEYAGGSKVIFWTPDYIKKYLDRPSPFDLESQTVISRIRADYGLINVMDGFYERGGVVSTYFFNTLGQRNGNINEGEQNFHMDTLRLFID